LVDTKTSWSLKTSMSFGADQTVNQIIEQGIT